MQIRLSDIHKAYGQTSVLRGINLEIPAHTELAIMGASGSGKSTLLYILGGLEQSDRGTVQMGKFELNTMSDQKLAEFRNEHVGFIFQHHFLLPSMNCLANILLPARIGGKEIKSVKKQILEYAEILNVSHCLKKYPYEISGGEQQRINIIRAISLSPQMLLCDEPTGSLDSKNTEIVIKLLRDVSKKISATLVIVTHDLKISENFDRKITIEDGQIIG